MSISLYVKVSDNERTGRVDPVEIILSLDDGILSEENSGSVRVLQNSSTKSRARQYAVHILQNRTSSDYDTGVISTPEHHDVDWVKNFAAKFRPRFK